LPKLREDHAADYHNRGSSEHGDERWLGCSLSSDESENAKENHKRYKDEDGKTIYLVHEFTFLPVSNAFISGAALPRPTACAC